MTLTANFRSQIAERQSGCWEVGDLALCVKVGPWRRKYEFFWSEKATGPRAGQVLRVRSVHPFGASRLGLRFADFPDCHDPNWFGFNAARFRKVTPPAADEFDTEVIEAMRGAPVGEPA